MRVPLSDARLEWVVCAPVALAWRLCCHGEMQLQTPISHRLVVGGRVLISASVLNRTTRRILPIFVWEPTGGERLGRMRHGPPCLSNSDAEAWIRAQALQEIAERPLAAGLPIPTVSAPDRQPDWVLSAPHVVAGYIDNLGEGIHRVGDVVFDVAWPSVNGWTLQ